VIAVLQKHFVSKPAVIADRFKFNKREQLPGESLADYIAGLCCLATCFEFGGYPDDALRDRFICGLHSKGTQKRLITVKNLTLQEAMEAAEKDSKALHGSKGSNIQQVSKVPVQSNWRQSPPCYRCGKTNHHPSKCQFILATCRTCGKMGHIAAVYNSGKGNKTTVLKLQYVFTEVQVNKS